MGLMSDKERFEFQRSLTTKPVSELQELFNKFSKDENDEQLNDNTRAQVHEKAALVQREIILRG